MDISSIGECVRISSDGNELSVTVEVLKTEGGYYAEADTIEYPLAGRYSVCSFGTGVDQLWPGRVIVLGITGD